MRNSADAFDFIDSAVVESEVLSPEDYLELYATRPHMIESTKILPSRLGEEAFGKILVKYSRPLYKAILD